MIYECSVWNCRSNGFSTVNGRQIKLFSYPSDKRIKEQWENICKFICTNETEELFCLCELHFEKCCFTEQMKLVSNAVPTIFDHPNRRKCQKESPSSSITTNTPVKKFKSRTRKLSVKNIEEDEELPMHISPEATIKSPECLQENSQTLNNSLTTPLKSATTPVLYRLVIEIDKVETPSISKSRSSLRLSLSKRKFKSANNIQRPRNDSHQKSPDKVDQQNSRVSDQHVLTKSNQDKLKPLKVGDQKKPSKSSKKPKKSNSTNSLKYRCEKGCQLEKIVSGCISTYKCMKCNNIYKGSNENGQQISNQNNVSSQGRSTPLKDSNCKKPIKKLLKSKNNLSKPSATSDIPRKKILEHLIYTPGNISPCKVSCQLKKIIFNNDDAYKCKKCNNIYRKTVRKALRVPLSVESETGKDILTETLQDTFNESDSQNLSNSARNVLTVIHEEKSNYLKESQKESDIKSFKTAILPNTAVNNIFQNLINTSGIFSRCEGGCKLMKIIWNDSIAFRCKQCNQIYIPQPVNDSNGKLNEANDIVKAKNANEIIELDNNDRQCVTCNQTFETPGMLFSHVKKHLTCKICHFVFKTQFEYKTHLKMHIAENEKEPFQCHICDFPFDSEAKVKHHISTVHNITADSENGVPHQSFVNAFQCSDCKTIFMSEDSLREHMNSEHNITDNVIPTKGEIKSVKFSCTICEMEFPTLAEIQMHTEIHLQDEAEDFKCNICQHVFEDKDLFQNHLQEHIARAHRCNKCRKAFINKSSLQMHLRNHD